jgi:hypothetical protein
MAYIPDEEKMEPQENEARTTAATSFKLLPQWAC